MCKIPHYPFLLSKPNYFLAKLYIDQPALYLSKLGRRDLVPIVQPSILQLLISLIDLPLLLTQNVSSCRCRTTHDSQLFF